jgi:FAD/FMN-containing dehydrogenase
MISAPTVAAELSDIVGSGRVVADSAALQGVLDSYQGPAQVVAPIAVVYPCDAEDVRNVVDYARKTCINLVPVSSAGGPRTLRDSLPSPTETSSVMVDMSRMKKIVRIDRRNRVALIEPGITFPELSAAATEHGLRVAHPLRPRANKSAIASYLDREPTLIPKNHWDITDPLLCVEFILGTGELFRTGSAAGPGTLEEQWASGVAQTNPMGPAHTDLGRALMGGQGTLGIVTWASVRMDLVPSIRKIFFVGADALKDLEPFIYAGTRRRLGDEYVLLNNMALASMLRGTADEIRSLREGLPSWILAVVLAGYDYFPEEKMAYEERALVEAAAEVGVGLSDVLPGVDSEEILTMLDSCETGTSWKHRLCGASVDLFFVSTLDKASSYVDAVSALAGGQGFATEGIGVYLQPSQQGRTVHIEINVPYDTDQEQKAVVFHNAAVDLLLDMGAFFSRPHGLAASKVFARVPDHVAMLNKLKSVLDPDAVFNRGKLCF